MGKIKCSKCKKSCSGEAIRLNDKYFHAKCFKCIDCSKDLAAGGFFQKDADVFCGDCYQKKFGTKCHACGKFVEGEVLTALGNHYHHECFACNKCKRKFEAGDKVTYSGTEFLCKQCLPPESPTQNSPQESPIKDGIDGGKNGTANHILENSNSSSPGPSSSSSPPTGPAVPDSLPGPMTSTPAKRFSTEAKPTTPSTIESVSSPASDDGHLSPGNNQYFDRSTSPGSFGSRSSIRSSGRWSTSRTSSQYDPKFDANYGKFYKSTFLNPDGSIKQTYKKYPPSTPNLPKSPHYHRPANFSYSKVTSGYIRPMRKASESSQGNRPRSPAPLNNEEPVRLSSYPGAHEREFGDTYPVESGYWPGPPEPAAVMPERLRKSPHGRRSTPITDDEAEEEEEEVEVPTVDPLLEKEIEMLSKMDSGLAKELRKELEEKRKKAPPPLDPISSSRVPSADHEPPFRTRYETPYHASPSRDTIRPPSKYSLDDSVFAYRSCATLPSYPDDRKRRYRPPTNIIPNLRVPKPGYGLGGKSSTLPVGANLSLGSYEFKEQNSHHISESDMEDEPRRFKRASRSRESVGSEPGSFFPYFRFSSYLAFKRHGQQEPPKTYPYEKLKVTNFDLPKGVDRNNLERHLSHDAFQDLFQMPHDEFYRLAEWKQNDIKRKICLY